MYASGSTLDEAYRTDSEEESEDPFEVEMKELVRFFGGAILARAKSWTTWRRQSFEPEEIIIRSLGEAIVTRVKSWISWRRQNFIPREALSKDADPEEKEDSEENEEIHRTGLSKDAMERDLGFTMSLQQEVRSQQDGKRMRMRSTSEPCKTTAPRIQGITRSSSTTGVPYSFWANLTSHDMDARDLIEQDSRISPEDEEIGELESEEDRS